MACTQRHSRQQPCAHPAGKPTFAGNSFYEIHLPSKFGIIYNYRQALYYFSNKITTYQPGRDCFCPGTLYL